MITERAPRERKRVVMVNRLSGTALENALAELNRRRAAYWRAKELSNRAWDDYQKQNEFVKGGL